MNTPDSGKGKQRLDSGVSRRSVLVALGSSGVTTGLSGCATDGDDPESGQQNGATNDGRDGNGTTDTEDGDGSRDDRTDDETESDSEGESSSGGEGPWMWADPTHDLSVDQSDVDLAERFVSGDESPSSNQRRVTDLAGPCGELTAADSQLIAGYVSGSCAEANVEIECWPYKETLVPDRRSIDVGELQAGGRDERTITVKNEGNEELTARFSVQGGPGIGIRNDGATRTLAPGESTGVTLTIEATEPGVIEGTVLATVNGHVSWITGIRARVPPDLEALIQSLESDLPEPEPGEGS